MFSDIQNIHSASEPLKTEAVDSRLGNKNNSNKDQNKSRAKSDGDDENKQTSTDEANSNALNNPDTTVNNKDDESINRFSVDSLIFFLEDFLEDHMILLAMQKSKMQDDPHIQPTKVVSTQKQVQDISTSAPWLRSKHVNSNPSTNPSSSPSLSSLQNSEKPRNVVTPRYAAHAYAHRALSNNVSPPAHRKNKRHGAFEKIADSIPSTVHSENSKEEISDIYNLIQDLRVMKELGTTHLDVKDNAALLEGIGAAIRKDGHP